MGTTQDCGRSVPLRRAIGAMRREVMNALRHRVGCWRARRLTFSGMQLNVGCGKYPLPGWTNADLRPGAELVFDIRSMWPVPDGQCRRVRLEHVLEHVAYPDEARHVLRESLRVLAEGGVVLVGVPDTEKVLRAYLEGDRAEFFRLARERWHPADVRLPIEHVNYHFRDRYGEHLFAYDRQALTALLARAGFVQIHDAPFDPSVDREDREAGTLRMSGTKPLRLEVERGLP